MNARLWVVALLCLLTACSDPDPRTQITFRLDAPPNVVERVNELEVTIRSQVANEPPRTFKRDELTFPVEIVVVAKGDNRTTRSVRFLGIARDDAGREIARWEQTANFVPRENSIEPIAANILNPGSSSGDAGADGGGTRPDASDELDAQPGERDAQQDAQQPVGERDGAISDDASSGTVNCASAGTSVRCDDANACNGTERCEPASARADERGCVQGDDVVRCNANSTCDKETGKCSTCGVMPDGDGDGARSMTCGGNDCDDNDESSAPGKVEKCDGKDNDCNGTVDGMQANADCAAPQNGTASCEMGRCTQRCNDANHQIENGVCVPPVGSCPIVNPCAPGRCVPARGSYTCECPSGYRAGLTRCAPSGVKRRTLGFETTCDAMATPGSFVMGVKSVPSNLYASCGVAALASGAAGQVQLFEPMPATIEGATGTVVLTGASAAPGAPSEIAITFSPGVNEVVLDVLDIDNATGLRARFEGADGTALLEASPQPSAGSKRVRVTHTSATPIARTVLSYMPSAADDGWYIDELTFDVWGCGDAEREMAAGEACDDGNAVQCDGCDNACAVSPAVCMAGPQPTGAIAPGP